MTTSAELRAAIRGHIGEPVTFERAVEWMRRWYFQDEQQLPPFGMFSLRAMAFHVSNTLDDTDGVDCGSLTCYLDAKHGPALYWGTLEGGTP